MINKGNMPYHNYSIPYLYYSVDETKPTVMFFSGMFNKIDTWNYVVTDEKITSNYNILFFSYRGQEGVLDGIQNDEFTIDEITDANNCLLEHLGINQRKLYLIGYSSGCVLAMDFLKKFSDRVESILFINPYLPFDYLSREKLKSDYKIGEKVNEDIISEYMDLYYYDLFSDHYKELLSKLRIMKAYLLGQIKKHPEIVNGMVKIKKIIYDFAKTVDDEFLNSLKDISGDICIVAGGTDRFGNHSYLSEFAEKSGAKITVLPYGGHLWPILEEKDAFVDIIHNNLQLMVDNARERRNSERIEVKIPISLQVEGKEIITGKILNINDNGMRLEIPNDGEYEKDTILRVFTDNVLKLDMQVRVIWSDLKESCRNIGVQKI